MERESPKPLYVEIAGRLRRYIDEHRLVGGDRLKSEPKLAREFGVAPMTMRRAVGLLVEEGRLVRKNGIGTFVVSVGRRRAGAYREIMVPRFVRYAGREITVETPDWMPHQMAFWGKVVEAFEKENPGLKVRIVTGPEADRSGDPVCGDVVITTLRSLPFYLERDLIGAVGAFDGGRFDKCFSEANGTGYPFKLVFDYLLVNVDLAERLGVDWRACGTYGKFIGAVRRAGETAGIGGVAMSATLPYQLLGNTRCGSYAGMRGSFGKLQKTLADFLEAGGAVELLDEDSEGRFEGGRTLFCQTIMYRAEVMASRCGFRVAAGLLPVAGRPYYLGAVACVAKRSGVFDAAESFARYLSGVKVQRLIANERYSVPARRGAQGGYFAGGIGGFGGLRDVLRRGFHCGAAYRDFLEFSETILAPWTEKILMREVALCDGIAEMKRLTEKLARGEYGWRAGVER